MKESIRLAIEKEIASLTTACGNIAKEIELMKSELAKKEKELDNGMNNLEELHEFLEVEKEEKPAEKKKRGRKAKEPEEEMKTDRKEYDHKRYELKKSQAKEIIEEPKEKNTLAEVNAKAREAGMTYGQYLAQREIKKLSEEMRQSREARHRKAAENDSERIPEQDPVN